MLLKWNWIFFVNIPLGFIGVFLVQKFVPNIRPHIEQHFDILGAVAMFLALGSLLISLSLGQIQGFNNPLVLGLLGGFFIFITLFIIIEKRNIQPMLDLSLFKNSDFSINILTGFLSFVSMSGTIILLPFFLTNVLLFLPSKIGLLMGVVPLVIAFTSPISGKLSDRLGTRLIAILGLISLFLGILALSTIDVDTTALGYILRTIPIGLGMGLFQSPNNSAIMGSVPKNRLGNRCGNAIHHAYARSDNWNCNFRGSLGKQGCCLFGEDANWRCFYSSGSYTSNQYAGCFTFLFNCRFCCHSVGSLGIYQGAQTFSSPSR